MAYWMEGFYKKYHSGKVSFEELCKSKRLERKQMQQYYKALFEKADSSLKEVAAEVLPIIGDEPETIFEAQYFGGAGLEKNKEGRRVINALLRGGIEAIEDLTYVTEEELKSIDTIGEATFSRIKKFCDKKNISIGSNADDVPLFQKGDVVISRVLAHYDGRWFQRGTKWVVREIFSYSDKYSDKDSFSLPCYSCYLFGEAEPKGEPITRGRVFTTSELVRQ